MITGLSNQQERVSSCTNIDLRESNPLLRRVRNQDKTGWCFAFSMADLYTHHYRKRIQVYPTKFSHQLQLLLIIILMTGLLHGRIDLEILEKVTQLSVMKGSSVLYCLHRYLSGFGICLESAVRTPDALVRHIQNIERIARMRQEAYGSGEISAEESRQLVNRVKSCSGVEESLHAVFPQMSWDNLSQILIDTETSSFIRDLTNFSCRNNKRQLSGEIDSRLRNSSFFPSRGVTAINNSLERGNPIEFTYDSKITDVGKNVPKDTFSMTSGEMHSSLIVGVALIKIADLVSTL